jgi:hypothetical protein
MMFTYLREAIAWLTIAVLVEGVIYVGVKLTKSIGACV